MICAQPDPHTLCMTNAASRNGCVSVPAVNLRVRHGELKRRGRLTKLTTQHVSLVVRGQARLYTYALYNPNFTLSRLDCPAANFIFTLSKQSDGESRRDRSSHDTHVQSSSRTAAQLYRLSFVTASAGGNRRTVPGFCNRFHMRANFCEDVHHQEDTNRRLCVPKGVLALSGDLFFPNTLMQTRSYSPGSLSLHS